MFKNFLLSSFLFILASPNTFAAGSALPEREFQVALPEIVSAWYHHWWYPGRFAGNGSNYRYEPLLGKYNINDSTVRQHVKWAKKYGINTFGIDLWIDQANWNGWVERHTEIVTRVFDQEGMNYFFLIDRDLQNGGWQKYQPELIAAETVKRIKKYYKRPSYLNYRSKPVLFFWAAYNTDCGFWFKVVKLIKKEIGPFTFAADLPCADIRMLYNPYSPIMGSDIGLQNSRQLSLWKDRAEDLKPWVPTALAGYDDTRVRSGNPPVALSPKGFQKSIQNALKYPQHLEGGKKWLMINSWNEWHEGSQIEPSKDMSKPFQLLEVLREELQRVTNPVVYDDLK